MREIKFRAKATHNNRWYYGAYYEHINRQLCPFGDEEQKEDIEPIIITSGFADWNLPRPLQRVDVNSETVGQYTGIKDKNGKEIYEGDIVLCERNITPSIDKYTYIVGWNAEDARYNFIYKGGWSEIDACNHIFMEVIGNIYENPELLEVYE